MTDTYRPEWHALEAADERAWLDQWARLQLLPAAADREERFTAVNQNARQGPSERSARAAADLQ